VRLFCILLFMGGCSLKQEPQIWDTELDPSKRNWEEVYEHELKEAIKNQDDESFHFFWPLYIKELSKNNKTIIIYRSDLDQ